MSAEATIKRAPPRRTPSPLLQSPRRPPALSAAQLTLCFVFSCPCNALPQLEAPGELPAELAASIEANINIRWCVRLPLPLPLSCTSHW